MKPWIGPREGELNSLGVLNVDLPPHRWPYCLPSEHDEGCTLHCYGGKRGSFCDCSASAADDKDPIPLSNAAAAGEK